MQQQTDEIRPVVLLVEDSAADANLVKEALAEERLDCGLYVLRDGAVAIDFIERVDTDDAYPCPDLVLLDLNLPKVNGVEILKRVRLSPRCGRAKVLIISSSNAASDRERVMALGATGYFRKPSSLDEFMRLGATVREMLQS